jgi:hypothetical protein
MDFTTEELSSIPERGKIGIFLFIALRLALGPDNMGSVPSNKTAGT